jgi:hypothetical protein
MFGYLGVVLHAFFAGSDSSLVGVQLIYLTTFLVVVFLTSYWLIQARQNKKAREMKILPPGGSKRSNVEKEVV